jgi:hypothetical protein
MTGDEREATFRAFYMGKDAIPGDLNPYKPGTSEANAWANGFASEYGERTPITDEEVKAAWPR